MSELTRYRDRGFAGQRDVFSAFAQSLLDFHLNSKLPSQHFVLFIACDYMGVDDEILIQFGTRMLEAGACYFSAWGPDCSRADTMFDMAYMQRERAAGVDLPLVMTTWHEDNSLDEALFFALELSYPGDDSYYDTCKTMVALTVGNQDWDNHIQARLSAVSEFIDGVLAEDD